jgi:hypothetical protein
VQIVNWFDCADAVSPAKAALAVVAPMYCEKMAESARAKDSSAVRQKRLGKIMVLMAIEIELYLVGGKNRKMVAFSRL